MSRVQLALNVDDIDAATSFYTTLFGVQPAKTRPGYANFAIASPPLKLVLIENPGQGGSLNHLGVEVESASDVEAHQVRLTDAGFLADEEKNVTCCYAVQDKFWVTGPNGEKWEHYAVIADSPTFYDEATDGDPCCGTDFRAGETPAGEDAATAAACC